MAVILKGVTHLRVSPTFLNPNMLVEKKSTERSHSSLILSSLALHLGVAPSLAEHVKFKCGADEVDQGGLLEEEEKKKRPTKDQRCFP